MQIEAHVPSLSLHRGHLIIKNYIKFVSKPSTFTTKEKLGLNIFLPEIPLIPNSFAHKALFWLNKFEMDPIEPFQTSIFSPIPPWRTINNLITTFYDYKENIKDNLSFTNYISQTFPDHDAIYTDGSKTSSPLSTACAIHIPSRPSSHAWKLDPSHSVLSSELFAIYQALVFSSFDMQKNHIVLSDSRTALLLISNPDPQSHQNLVYSIQRQLLFLNRSKSVSVHWVKGHAGIVGNEKADQAANWGHSKVNISFLPLSSSVYQSMLKEKFYKYWEKSWKDDVDNTNKGKFLMMIRQGSIKRNLLILNSLSRREQVLITRLRIGHAGLQAYLHRFNIIQDDVCPHCGQDQETFEHFFFDCPTFDAERYELLRKLALSNIMQPTLRILFAGDQSVDNLLVIKAVIGYLADCGKNLTL